MAMRDLRAIMEASKPYLVMTLTPLCLALYLTLLSSVLSPSNAVSPVVVAVYQQLVSAALLSSLALLLDRGNRPPLSLRVLSWSFLVGLLQIPLGELLLTMSLRYITATFQSVALNTVPVLVFVLAVISRRERFRFWGLNDQAKLWGILASTAGATVMVILSDPGIRDPISLAGEPAGRTVGCLLVWCAVLAQSAASILVERVALQYPASLSLSAMMNAFGTVQVAIVAALLERNPSSWRIRCGGSPELLAILYGGLVVTGVTYFARNWCIHKNGPVFTFAFSPLLVVFSFLLEKFVLKTSRVQLWSFVGSVLVIGGLYLLLWAKSKEYKMERIENGCEGHSFEGRSAEPLLLK